MNIRLYELLQSIQKTLDQIEVKQLQMYNLETKEIQMSAALLAAVATLQTQVKANTDVEASAVQAINGVADQLTLLAKEMTDDSTAQAAVLDAASTLHASADGLGAAIANTTPVSPTP